jgi:hypothetical protein
MIDDSHDIALTCDEFEASAVTRPPLRIKLRNKSYLLALILFDNDTYPYIEWALRG